MLCGVLYVVVVLNAVEHFGRSWYSLSGIGDFSLELRTQKATFVLPASLDGASYVFLVYFDYISLSLLKNFSQQIQCSSLSCPCSETQVYMTVTYSLFLKMVNVG